MLFIPFFLFETGTQKVLSPSNGPADKTSVTKSPLKSPPSKLVTAKSAILKSNDTGKINLTKSKMESSPPKVARSPSNKSITPPGKSPTKSPLSSSTKPTLDKSNSQGDIAVSSGLRNAVTGIVALDNEGNLNNFLTCFYHRVSRLLIFVVLSTVTNTAEVKPTETNRESETAAVESKIESEPKTDEPAATGISSSAIGDASNADLANSTKVEQTLDKQQIAISEQKHASGDGALPMNDKVEVIESAGEGATSETKQSDKSENYENCTQNAPASGVTLTVIKKETPGNDTTDVSQVSDAKVDVTDSKNDSQQIKPDDESVKQEDTTVLSQSPNTSTSDCANISAETAETAKLTDESEIIENTVPEISKQSYRLKVWDQLENNDLVLFPRPCKGRIPNFKGAHQAAEQLANSKVFKNCKTIKVNPDKAQEMVRFHTLEVI